MTAISQRPALGTLDRCSCVALVLHLFVGFKLFILRMLKIMCVVKKKSYVCDCLQCPPNLHKQDGYLCQVNQVRRLMTLGNVLVQKGAVVHQNNSLGAADWECIYHLILSVWRAAATTESARPERTSVNTSGGQVRLIFLVLVRVSSYRDPVWKETCDSQSCAVHPSSLSLRVRRLGEVLLWEAEHGGHREGQLWKGWRKMDPV